MSSAALLFTGSLLLPLHRHRRVVGEDRLERKQATTAAMPAATTGSRNGKQLAIQSQGDWDAARAEEGEDRLERTITMSDLIKLPPRCRRFQLPQRLLGRTIRNGSASVEEGGELFIRANQGHAVKTFETESLLKPILSAEEVPVCVHETYRKNLKPILETGLNRMQRLHVHFSRGLPADGEVISGTMSSVLGCYTGRPKGLGRGKGPGRGRGKVIKGLCPPMVLGVGARVPARRVLEKPPKCEYSLTSRHQLLKVCCSNVNTL